MEDDQQFCLRWNNHQSTLVQNFDTLLESGTLVDCTLAAEGKSLKAHKVVLSACSPFFEGLLSEHYDKHPVFILKDIKFKELKAMMDYMYKGEVNISQDQLAALLKAAESLQIKGLSECKTSGNSGGGGCGGRSEPRPPKVVSQPTAPSLDIPHPSSGLTIEKNSKVPRQSLTQVSVGDLPEDSASPQLPRGLSSREGSQSPTNAKRKKRFRGRSLGDDNSVENHDASNSSDMPQQMGVSSLAIAPVANEKSHADPTDSLGSSVLMQQLAKPADEMLQMPLENQQPNDNLIEPKSEYLEDPEESVEDLTLDDDMNDLNEMEQDTNRAGPSHESSQHPGLAAWHVTGDRSNAGGVVGSVAGAPGTNDEVFLAAQEAAQAHRDSQEYLVENFEDDDECLTNDEEEQMSKESFVKVIKTPITNVKGISELFEVSKEGEIILKSNENHILTLKDPTYECEACGKTYAWATSLSRHRRECQERKILLEQTEEINSEEEIIKDSIENPGSSTSSPRDDEDMVQEDAVAKYKPRFRELQKYVSKDGVYSCWDCGKYYLWASSLSRHRTIECGPKNKKRFVCNLCNYRTGYKGNFVRHLKAPRHIMHSSLEKKRMQIATLKKKNVSEEADEELEETA
ncbi:modifier of mdg4 isoform X5 [Cephus cinctus]|uniref:Modifier of mdg4 isoform X5 n=1 Tax=Cephus cinctus TaxID=211228 RepID=A0AAJ7FE14_CEPCN|nr:modifier of mdg4 isoform X5 [Cephus cinctus]